MVNEQQQPEQTLEPEAEAEIATEKENQEQAESQVEGQADESSQIGAEDEHEAIIEALQQEIKSLIEKLATQKEQFESYKSQYVRIAADFDNFRKRTQKEKEELEHQVKSSTINELLPVVDNFERARTQIKPANEGEMGIHKSYQGVYKNLVDSLKRIGVSAMKPEGQTFDPNFHEAMLREPTDEYPEDTVIEQLMRGYLLGERVLRHAMVKVAAAKESVITSEENNAESEGDSQSADS